MRVIKTPKAMERCISSFKNKNETIGFVPTMGALHEGHLSLVKAARKECDKVVVSIFVNPAQFGPKEDYKKYPRHFKLDKVLLDKSGVDIIYYPDAKSMYPEGYLTYVTVEKITGILCGKSRPQHFKGVTTIVAKFFNIIKPDIAYFGKKDAQQFFVIKKMADDLNISVKLKAMPTIREKDGLAMSSRNRYLLEEERIEAVILYKALKLAKYLIVKKGLKNKKNVIDEIKKFILAGTKKTKIDYLDIVNAENLKEIDYLKGKILVALAVWVGKTRLIDNIILNI